MPGGSVEDLIRHLVTPIVQDPDDVEILDDGDGRYRLRLAPDDVGRVIGRRGRTAKALRTVLRAAGANDLEIEDAHE